MGNLTKKNTKMILGCRHLLIIKLMCIMRVIRRVYEALELNEKLMQWFGEPLTPIRNYRVLLGL